MTRAKYPEKLLSVQEIALLTGLHPNTVRKEINDVAGGLHKGATTLAGKLLVPVSTFNSWVEQGQLEASA